MREPEVAEHRPKAIDMFLRMHQRRVVQLVRDKEWHAVPEHHMVALEQWYSSKPRISNHENLPSLP
jgi:hypothetical protein